MGNLDSILNIKMSSDKEKREWQEVPIKIIRENFIEEGITDLEKITEFVHDQIKVLEHEISHADKWSGVYHKNVSANRRTEISAYEQILEKIKGLAQK